MKLAVTIIIPNYNGNALLAECLASLEKNGYLENPKVECLVVDDASPRENPAGVCERYPPVKLIRLARHGSFPVVCNAGAKASSGDLLLFLNNDVTVTPGFLDPLVEHFKASDVFAVCPQILLPHGHNEAEVSARFEGGFLRLFKPTQSKTPAAPNSTRPIIYPCGAAALIDRKKFEELHGFDELFRPGYWEDVDLGFRAWRRGWKSLYEEKSVVHHQGGATNKKQHAWIQHTWGAKNEYLFMWKNVLNRKRLMLHTLQRLLLQLFIPNLVQWAGIFLALRQLPEALRKRRQEQPFGERSEEEILMRINTQKILVIRPDKVGDIVVLTPLLSFLKDWFPQAHTTIVVQKYTAQLLQGSPLVDDIFLAPLPSSGAPSFSTFWNLIQELRRREFDLVVHADSDVRYALACFLARVPYRFGDRLRSNMTLFCNQPNYQKFRNIPIHSVQRNFELVKNLRPNPFQYPLALPVHPEQRHQMEERMRERGATPTDLLIGLHLGLGGNEKMYPVRSWRRVARKLVEKFSAKIVLTGSAPERPLADDFLKEWNGPLLDFVGQTTLAELTALISLCRLFISVDTGPFHIASALQVPLVAILPTKSQKPVHWAPWLSPHILVRDPWKCNLICRPGRCPETYCTDAISPDQVVRAAEQLLTGAAPQPFKASFREWVRTSLRPLIFVHPEAATHPLRKVAIQLAQAGWHPVILQDQPNVKQPGEDMEPFGIPQENVSLSWSPSTVAKLADLFGRYEISHIHAHRPERKPLFWLAAHWASMSDKVSPPPLFMLDPTAAERSVEEIEDFYLQEFARVRPLS